MTFLRQLNEVCQSSSLSSEMLGIKAADFYKQITLLNFNEFQINEISNVLNRFSRVKQCVKQVLNRCLCTVKWRQWRSKLNQTKKIQTAVRSWSKDGMTETTEQ